MTRDSIFDYIGNLDTLIAVIVGACLATGGALVAEVIQERLRRRHRQREAARFFGEIIISISQVFDLAVESQKIGDPWGAFTVNMFRVCAHEAEIYTRNRERLFDIPDMQLRFKIHGHLLRFTVPISGILRESADIDALQTRLEEEDALSETLGASLRARMERFQGFRDGSLTAALQQRATSEVLLKQLEKVAGVPFEAKY